MLWSEARDQKRLTPKEIKQDLEYAANVKWLEDVQEWLQANPEVGILNSHSINMKFYVWPVGGEYREIQAFSEVS
jgi:hypothetical protein